MMGLGLIICAGVLAGVAWQWYRYPGRWEHAFSPRHTEARKVLSDARGAARAWERWKNQTESKARNDADAAEKAREERLHRLEQRIASLSSPGSGERVESLGELDLFQHVLVVRSASGTRSIALAGMKVRFEPGLKIHSVYCTDADGHVHRAKYPHLASSPGSEAELFDEDRVRDFAVVIENTVAQENTFRGRLPRQLKKAQSKWEEAQADASEVDAARARLQKVRQRNGTDPRGEAVEARLAEASRDWERLTGRIPPR
ncbi:hypothetical protein HHL19_18620 [Streptomyces sp. R302]|uniref:hypothetical protein n=1 Tax=unclassified Streptomyces TaxID=2593676 RepID=UPI00145EF375|nr:MULTISPECIES: hypothetical protein [unclassified Streptomyces]NML54804.1 hypothetical protein [Streptomyces sp. R301]NML80627.1 hypothetical protein [Streptomyces sp. R302]